MQVSTYRTPRLLFQAIYGTVDRDMRHLVFILFGRAIKFEWMAREVEHFEWRVRSLSHISRDGKTKVYDPDLLYRLFGV